MTETCVNGHIRTEENTRFHKRGRGEQLKRVCSDCRKIRNNNRPAAHESQMKRTTELHEDVEDLIRFGATYQEIIQRAGFSSWGSMRASLARRGREDLLEKMRAKRGEKPQAELSSSVIPGKVYKKKKEAASYRGEWIASFN